MRNIERCFEEVEEILKYVIPEGKDLTLRMILVCDTKLIGDLFEAGLRGSGDFRPFAEVIAWQYREKISKRMPTADELIEFHLAKKKLIQEDKDTWGPYPPRGFLNFQGELA